MKSKTINKADVDNLKKKSSQNWTFYGLQPKGNKNAPNESSVSRKNDLTTNEGTHIFAFDQFDCCSI